MTIQPWGLAPFNVTDEDGTIRKIHVRGRDRWALECLIEAGERGCTPICHPGPRWSGYVFNLRREHKLTVETVTEQHEGPFAGHHARYKLRTAVRRDDGAPQ